MKFVLCTIASTEEKWSASATELYLEKISHFTKIEVLQLKPAKISRDSSEEKRKSETVSILGALKPDDFVILLDERGRGLDSIQFSKQVESILQSGKKRCVWVIGGAYGVGQEVQDRANLKSSLAPFVLNHLLARVVLLEQLYRAFTIIKNIPYHNK